MAMEFTSRVNCFSVEAFLIYGNKVNVSALPDALNAEFYGNQNQQNQSLLFEVQKYVYIYQSREAGGGLRR